MDLGAESAPRATQGLIAFFSGARRVPVRPHHGGIQKHDAQVHALEPLQQPQNLPPDPSRDPALPAHVDRVPGAVSVRQIPPGCARAQYMENPSNTSRFLTVGGRPRRPCSGGSNRLICSNCSFVR